MCILWDYPDFTSDFEKAIFQGIIDSLNISKLQAKITNTVLYINIHHYENRDYVVRSKFQFRIKGNNICGERLIQMMAPIIWSNNIEYNTIDFNKLIQDLYDPQSLEKTITFINSSPQFLKLKMGKKWAYE